MSAERKIGTATFKAAKLPPRDAQRLLLRIGKIVGPGLTRLVAALKGEDEGERDTAAVEVIAEMIAKADIDEADSLLVYLCSKAMIKEEGLPYVDVVFDHHFQDDLMQAWQVAYFVLEVNFRDFFGAAAKSGLAKGMLSSARTKPAA